MGQGEVTREDDEQTFSEVLGEAVRVVEDEGLPFVVFGSIASIIYGRPGKTGDIDFLMKPQDATRALEALERAGFEAKVDNPRWLFKAFRSGVLVDIITQIKRDMHLDDEAYERARVEEFAGQKLRLISPEDAVLVEAMSHEDQVPEHWYNALGIMARTPLDWDYLVHRAQFSPRRILALLIYAQSNDLIVPEEPVQALYRQIYGT